VAYFYVLLLLSLSIVKLRLTTPNKVYDDDDDDVIIRNKFQSSNFIICNKMQKHVM